jgi:hypothetical protein
VSLGYSLKIVQENQRADKKRIGVLLGSRCIKLGIPVSDIAATLGVSRQTVYNWFVGLHEPHESHIKKIQKLISTFKK